MRSGRVVVLNGTTSAGKTTLAHALQARLAAAGECWIVIGLDDYFAKLPVDWVTYGAHIGAHADEGIAFVTRGGAAEWIVGPIADRLLAAYRGGVARAAAAGIDVIVDEVLLREEDWRAWRSELDGVDVRWVRVECALDTLEARERARGDRMDGLARAQHAIVHLFPTYDAVVDTAVTSADDAASQLVASLRWE